MLRRRPSKVQERRCGTGIESLVRVGEEGRGAWTGPPGVTRGVGVGGPATRDGSSERDETTRKQLKGRRRDKTLRLDLTFAGRRGLSVEALPQTRRRRG